MKKIFLLLIIFMLPLVVLAEEPIIGTITGENVSFRPCANADSDICPRIIGLYIGDEVTMSSKDLYTGRGCSYGWYKGTFDGKEGYVCSSYVTFKSVIPSLDPSTYTDYSKYLFDLGFKEPGYIEKLATLHAARPNWVFMPVVTSINWYSAVNGQSVGGKNCVYSANQGYYLTDSSVYNYLTDEFKTVDAGCYATNPETTAYYLDPRNWLSERNIFMFEDLSYHSEYQTQSLVNSILVNNNNLKNYVTEFYSASTQVMEDGSTKTISPIHLASRSNLEIGHKDTGLYRINGQYPYAYCSYTNLKGYYNFYNIGAYMDGCTPPNTPSARGMAYACGPNCNMGSTYGRPWDSPQKAINGGAQFIINNYFLRGQDTVYFQKFNTAGVTTPFTHQYMQNIVAPVSEAGTNFSSYSNGSALDNPIVFKIPVYIDMPLSTSLPNPGNPNNHLSNLLVNDVTITGFAHDVFEYNLIVPGNATNLKLGATVINAKAKASGTGVISINPNTSSVMVAVTAENGAVQEYTIKLTFSDANLALMSPDEMISNASVKSDGTYIIDIKEGQGSTDLINALLKINTNATVIVKDSLGITKNTALATGDTLVITSNGIVKEYPVVVVGDGSGDGLITIVDLLKVQKHILKVSNVSGVYLKAIDVDRDSQVTIMDLLKVQKHILGISRIE